MYGVAAAPLWRSSLRPRTASRRRPRGRSRSRRCRSGRRTRSSRGSSSAAARCRSWRCRSTADLCIGTDIRDNSNNLKLNPSFLKCIFRSERLGDRWCPEVGRRRRDSRSLLELDLHCRAFHVVFNFVLHHTFTCLSASAMRRLYCCCDCGGFVLLLLLRL